MGRVSSARSTSDCRGPVTHKGSGYRAADRGRSRKTTKRNAPAETLGPDGGPLTPAPGAAEGRAGKEKPTQNLFPSKMVKTGGERGRRRRSTGQGRDERHAGQGTARDTTCSGSPCRGNSGRRSGIGSHVGQGRCSRQKNMARQASGQQRPRRHVATAPYDTWYSLGNLQQAGILVVS